MKTRKKYEVEYYEPVCDLNTILRRTVSNISGPFGHLIEPVWNSHEHGSAKHIWITVTGRGQSYALTITDDGTGMDDARRKRALNRGFEAAELVGRNFQDLGLGRLSEFNHVRILTISAAEKAEDPEGYRMWEIEYDHDEMFSVWSREKKVRVPFRPLPPDWQLMGLPPGSTGVTIQLTQPGPQCSRFTSEKIRENLARHLRRPRIADKVTVNGQPLVKRALSGEPYYVTIDRHPKLGRVEIELYIPKSRTKDDQLMIGPFEGICDWRAFCRDIPEELFDEDLNILTDAVYGDILVEAFKRFVTSSRREFSPTLFTHPILGDFITFMTNEVCPQIADRLGIIRQTATDERDAQLLAELNKYASVLGGNVQLKPRPSVLTLDTSAIEVLANQPHPVEIRVDNYNPHLTIEWDTAHCGGTTDIAADQRTVRYRPGPTLGNEYQLSCHYVEEPDTKAGVAIAIVTAKKLRIDPAKRTCAPGRAVKLRAVNYEYDSSGPECLRWYTSETDLDGRFLVNIRGTKELRTIGYGPEVEYLPGYTPGEYTIILADSANPQHRKEIKLRQYRGLPRATIIVADPKARGPKTKPDKPSGSDEGPACSPRYVLAFDTLEHNPNLTRTLRGEGGATQITINQLHPHFRLAEREGSDAIKELGRNQLALHVMVDEARASNELLTPEEIIRMHGDTLAKIAKLNEKNTA